MKVLLSISLIGLYLLATNMNVLPWVEYVVNKDYIIAEKCENVDLPELKCDGKCYLAKQIKKAEQQESSTPFQSNLRTESFLSAHLFPETFQTPTWVGTCSETPDFLYFGATIPNPLLEVHTPPPESVA